MEVMQYFKMIESSKSGLILSETIPYYHQTNGYLQSMQCTELSNVAGIQSLYSFGL